MTQSISKLAILMSFLFLAGCQSVQRYCPVAPKIEGTINQKLLLSDLKTLSSDAMDGRRVGTEGSKKAAKFISKRFDEIGLIPLILNPNKKSFELPFKFGSSNQKSGVNVGGMIRGKTYPHQYLVVTAHYDHLGAKGGRIYNGADDNASGVSGMMSLAEYFSKNTPQHSIIFLATDAEESGLYGSKAFVKNPPVPIESIQFNLNLDMIGRGEKKNKLYIAGLRKNKYLKPIIQPKLHESKVCIVAGHEGRSIKRVGSASATNWDNASDHAPFLKRKIPYLYFGVDLHTDYHKTSDTFDKIDPIFFTATVESIIKVFATVDQSLKSVSQKNVPLDN